MGIDERMEQVDSSNEKSEWLRFNWPGLWLEERKTQLNKKHGSTPPLDFAIELMMKRELGVSYARFSKSSPAMERANMGRTVS